MQMELSTIAHLSKLLKNLHTIFSKTSSHSMRTPPKICSSQKSLHIRLNCSHEFPKSRTQRWLSRRTRETVNELGDADDTQKMQIKSEKCVVSFRISIVSMLSCISIVRLSLVVLPASRHQQTETSKHPKLSCLCCRL